MQRTKGPGCVGQPTTWGTDELAGLLVPVDPARPVAIVPVPNTAAGISTVIGGGLVDDTRIGVVAGRRFTLYLTEHRTTAPPNPRARKLVGGLGHPLSEDEEITGDVLVLGLAVTSNDDRDVPSAVIATARQLGLLT